MKISIRICRFIATLGPVGYVIAPGTVASILTLPVVYILQVYTQPHTYLAFVTIFLAISIALVHGALRGIGKRHDPSEIVLDEVMGCLLTFVAIPFTAKTALMGIVLFRFFDISKCLGIEKFEKFTGTWGVMLDDVAAGILSNLIMHILIVSLQN